MCGISGYITLYGDPSELTRYFFGVNLGVTERGPDRVGIVGYGPNEAIGSYKFEKVDEITIWQVSSVTTCLSRNRVGFLNFRGVPVTEDKGSGSQSIQPYSSNPQSDVDAKFFVTHNGQLSNDEEIVRQEGYSNLMQDVEHDIDSYVFLQLYMDSLKKIQHNTGNSADIHDRAKTWSKLLTRVEGSFAVALLDAEKQVYHFARNFLGLYFAVVTTANSRFIVWSSEEDSLQPRNYIKGEVAALVKEMPLYSHLSINQQDISSWANPNIQSNDLMDRLMGKVKPIDGTKSPENLNRAVVVFSGGLDSTVCATLAVDQYKEVHLLHFKYGARAQEKEIESVIKIHEELSLRNPECEVSLQFIDMDFLKHLGGSTLTDHSLQVAEGEVGAETTSEWVPARNIAMVGLAASYCDRHDIGNILLGLNREEGDVFEDNSSEFYKSMEKTLQLGTKARPKMVMPIGNMMKHHIVKLGMERNAPLEHSWSCYHGHEFRCGTCGPCMNRIRAFSMNGMADTVPYENEIWLKGVAEEVVDA